MLAKEKTRKGEDGPDASGRRRGGFRACTFIFILGALESMGFIANMASLVLYFYFIMHFDIPTSANTLTNFMGSVFLLSLAGACIADTFLNRFYTSLLFGVMEGLALLTAQAYFKDLQPGFCHRSTCVEGGQAVMFYGSLCLYALGSGGVKGAVPALGGDQFDHDHRKKGALARYYNWNLLISTAGSIVGVTAVVWVSMNKGWHRGFFISTMATLVGFAVLALGKPLYRIQPPGNNSTFVRIAQVVVVTFRNRHLSLPKNPDKLFEINGASRDPSEERLSHSDQFRLLDKAAILREGTEPRPWKVCTVTQVEEDDPHHSQYNFNEHNYRHSQSSKGSPWMHISAPKQSQPLSIPVIPLVFISVLIPIYEFAAVPFARKITGHPSGITQLQRVGVGLVLSILSMAVAGFVELHRKHEARKNPPNKISAFWLSFQYGIFGIAEMFTVVGLLEFFYKEAPSGMRSVSTSFTWLTLALGYFTSTVFVEIINSVTRRITPSRQGWLHGNDLNSNNLNLFYWFLAILNVINFAFYLFSASWYRYKSEDDRESETRPKAERGPSGETTQFK
uniref:Major facilitator superfamily (MFS) profile domain-containing protein n=1 Tax=Salix viminalis TaxID=40686 RepID=A0A6N2LVC2_SALVM